LLVFSSILLRLDASIPARTGSRDFNHGLLGRTPMTQHKRAESSAHFFMVRNVSEALN
jgi:hypothetical protein